MILFILSSLLLIFSFDVSAIESPIVLIHQKTSLGLVKEVVPVRGKFIIDGNVEEIHFTCWSPYPNKWIMIPSPVGRRIKISNYTHSLMNHELILVYLVNLARFGL